jgi:hypothetical protein
MLLTKYIVINANNAATFVFNFFSKTDSILSNPDRVDFDSTCLKLSFAYCRGGGIPLFYYFEKWSNFNFFCSIHSFQLI